MLPLKLPWELAQNRWSSQLNPILANPLNGISIIQVALVAGVNVINHKLGKVQQGWIFTDIDAAITAYRSAPFNNLTLTLTCSGPANVNIGVF